MKLALEVVKRYKLQEYASFLYYENDAAHAPYHSFCHGMEVLEYAENICNLQGSKASLPLAIACIFHDFNHSAGSMNDEWNVKTAIICMGNRLMPEHTHLKNEIETIIQATQYPYVIEKYDLNFEQAVIRDADLLQMTGGNYIRRIVIPLMQECNWQVDKAQDIQIAFLENLEMCFPESQKLLNAARPGLLEEMALLKDVLH